VYYDPDDLIGDISLKVFAQAQKGKYDPAKGKSTTWVHHVADNYCLSLLTHYKTQSRSACTTIRIHFPTATEPIDKSSDVNAKQLAAIDETPQLRASRNAVEKVLQYSDHRLRDLFSLMFAGKLRWEPASPIVEAMRQAAKQHGATLQDFEAVLHNMVA